MTGTVQKFVAEDVPPFGFVHAMGCARAVENAIFIIIELKLPHSDYAPIHVLCCECVRANGRLSAWNDMQIASAVFVGKHITLCFIFSISIPSAMQTTRTAIRINKSNRFYAFLMFIIFSICFEVLIHLMATQPVWPM